jgi:hypothetical protein
MTARNPHFSAGLLVTCVLLLALCVQSSAVARGNRRRRGIEATRRDAGSAVARGVSRSMTRRPTRASVSYHERSRSGDAAAREIDVAGLA